MFKPRDQNQDSNLELNSDYFYIFSPGYNFSILHRSDDTLWTWGHNKRPIGYIEKLRSDICEN